MSEKKGGLVIQDRPQISVEMDQHGDVLISLARIADDFNSVELTDITIPYDCVEEVAKAMLALLND